jgi:hypothetical protein
MTIFYDLHQQLNTLTEGVVGDKLVPDVHVLIEFLRKNGQRVEYLIHLHKAFVDILRFLILSQAST